MLPELDMKQSEQWAAVTTGSARQAHREGGNRGYFPGAPKLLSGPLRDFYFHDFYLYGLQLHIASLIFRFPWTQ